MMRNDFLFCQQYPGTTLLIKAAEKNQIAIVDQLLLARADIESKDEVIDRMKRIFLNPLYYFD
jgi:hypothetical protein